LKWFANNLMDKYRKSSLYESAIINNTLKTKNFKEKLGNLVSNLNIFSRSNNDLLKEID